MSYPEQGETIITAAQVRAMSRLLEVLSVEQVEQLTLALAEVSTNGQGHVTVKIYRGHPRFIEKTVTDDLRE